MQRETVSRWFAVPKYYARDKYDAPLATILSVHPDDLPYAHLLFQPDADIDPTVAAHQHLQPLDNLKTLSQRESRGGTTYSGTGPLAEASLPELLYEAARRLMFDADRTRERINRAVAHPWYAYVRAMIESDPPEPQKDDLLLPGEMTPLVREAEGLARTFDVPGLATSMRGEDPLDGLVDTIRGLCGSKIYQLYDDLMKARLRLRVGTITLAEYHNAVDPIKAEHRELLQSQSHAELDKAQRQFEVHTTGEAEQDAPGTGSFRLMIDQNTEGRKAAKRALEDRHFPSK
ncbi:hypothetical protein [Algisphaera agarilytica]|uniref:Uncharacterized protein n=1 Tax=Algisphaera agarilytica TaxID=1385975 RepID=A0A7X0H4N5_9BACT|nr:hypothetical protein [Algisphaera agarilytica]MBB6429203.1 hypothetical protein [Algisphaera agarilytica]